MKGYAIGVFVFVLTVAIAKLVLALTWTNLAFGAPFGLLSVAWFALGYREGAQSARAQERRQWCSAIAAWRQFNVPMGEIMRRADSIRDRGWSVKP